MTNPNIQQISFRTFSILSILLIATSFSWAQSDKTPKKLLKSSVAVKGHIGGEAHDSFVIWANNRRRMTVEISWRRKDNNKANFVVSYSSNFFDGEQVDFGGESYEGDRWTGIVPKSGKYYIYVTAHPDAKYTLKVTIE